MHYDFVAIPDADVPQAVEPTFQHALTAYARETAGSCKKSPFHGATRLE
jgi:hypothetical protein